MSLTTDEKVEAAIPVSQYKKQAAANTVRGIQKENEFQVFSEFDSSGNLRVLTWGSPNLEVKLAPSLVKNRLFLTSDGKLETMTQCHDTFFPTIEGLNKAKNSCVTITSSVCKDLAKADGESFSKYFPTAYSRGLDKPLSEADQKSYQENVQPHLKAFSKELKKIDSFKTQFLLSSDISCFYFKKCLQLTEGPVSGSGGPTEYLIGEGEVGVKTYGEALTMALYVVDQIKLCNQAQASGLLAQGQNAEKKSGDTQGPH